MAAKKSLGIYVHIPFCKSKCAYCDFYSLPRGEEQMDSYCRCLAEHLRAAAPRAAEYRVDTVYFGGGTPSLLGPDRLAGLLEALLSAYDVDGGAEITLEANPDSAGDPAALAALRGAGFNRVSLGMQSADDGELRRIGRIHTMDQVRRAADAVRTAGFANLSLDLIYGLPRQTMDRWQSNLEAAAGLSPEHLSCYGLKVEEGTPLFRCRDEAGLPGDEEQADMYLYTVERLGQLGYAQYEISNFARPGFSSRHNRRYWALGEYLGFGPGAHSDFGGVRYGYARDLEAWLSPAGEPPLSERQALSPADRAGEYLMLGLRTAEGISPRTLRDRYGGDFAPLVPFLEQCRRAGYALSRPDGSWRLTPRGFLLSNQIIVELLDRLS
ncbi:radical SAM family heme chaperone HemW [Dysosmobacter sp.]|uniref:radical SAM family heme chaperone HemW n=1 Tax=Dysosmobacter sp. TaxID=2591382 RepID=UPI002A86CF3C|nr:radical SAM family heme chaperone HemW [Dysosmobacter sp.]MDY3280760.1 radical SAM family heme chaperone HemW [Dysosmobacter sp.]